ncbi:MAG TPA: serine hydrolase domain-containing protein, partial [Candidatus Bathyarchaeia archaeon]|nr:serine hydrolase domain-containing protein [Candidatus Bathyarchaeia archaeon]
MRNRVLVLVLGSLLVLGACARDHVAPLGERTPLLLRANLGAVTAGLNASIPGLMKKAQIPGLQIALVRDGRVAWHQNYGVKNATTGARVTDETIFEAASLTKPLFAYLVMKLVDEGLIDLDRPFHLYFTREEIEKGLGHSLDAPGFKRAWFEKITTRHILSHSGGLPHGEGGEVVPIFFEPGTKWKYSATGYEYFQYAVEKLKGRKLDAIVQEYVLGPLGMSRSSMVWRPGYEETMANCH